MGWHRRYVEHQPAPDRFTEQSFEVDIIASRTAPQPPGGTRPRKEYLVRWTRRGPIYDELLPGNLGARIFSNSKPVHKLSTTSNNGPKPQPFSRLLPLELYTTHVFSLYPHPHSSGYDSIIISLHLPTETPARVSENHHVLTRYPCAFRSKRHATTLQAESMPERKWKENFDSLANVAANSSMQNDWEIIKG